MKVVITGGTGLIGQALTASLIQEHHEVVWLSRHANATPPEQVKVVQWLDNESSWVNTLNSAAAIVHLAGESIAGRRWNTDQKKRILESRQQSTRQLVDAIAHLEQPPHTLISASAVGYYGPRGDEEVVETDPPGEDFLSQVCVTWEEEAKRAAQFGLRVAHVRTGLVLGPGNGALSKMLLPFRLFVGGPLGKGQQWMPWIHIDDEVGIIRFLLEHEDAAGPFHATAPHPVTNRTFSQALGEVLHRPCWLPAPSALLRLALGEMADALLLSGQRAIPKRILEMGYPFQFTQLKSALEDILHSS